MIQAGFRCQLCSQYHITRGEPISALYTPAFTTSPKLYIVFLRINKVLKKKIKSFLSSSLIPVQVPAQSLLYTSNIHLSSGLVCNRNRHHATPVPFACVLHSAFLLLSKNCCWLILKYSKALWWMLKTLCVHRQDANPPPPHNNLPLGQTDLSNLLRKDDHSTASHLACKEQQCGGNRPASSELQIGYKSPCFTSVLYRTTTSSLGKKDKNC